MQLFDRRILNKTGLLPAALAAGFLLLAVSSHWPYSFYVLMRLTVCAIAIHLAHKSFVAGTTMRGWIIGAVAVLSTRFSRCGCIVLTGAP